MLLTVLVSLYTSRVVLEVLGVEDYGIYSLVGGVVVMFSFLNTALSSATQRFLTFELGCDNTEGFRKVLSFSLMIYLGISLLLLFVSETVGLWFLNTQLKIPVERMQAANWLYQFSIVSFVFSMLRTPYSAAVIAYERMSFFAYISIIEVVLKLLIVYLLLLLEFDKLVTYGALVAFVTFVITVFYYVYCVYELKNCRFSFTWDSILFRKLLKFSGWSLLGGISVVATNQGVNMLLNMFFGVIVNAAMGIANQVNALAGQLIGSFQTAFNPQIVKYYAMNDRSELLKLICRTSKFSYFLLMLISIPLLIEMPFVLSLWLPTVPDFTVEFCRLLLIASSFEALSGPLWMTVQATGEIRQYQLSLSFLLGLNLLIPYILFLWGYSPIAAFVTRVIISLLIYIYRLFILHNRIQLFIRSFWKLVFVPIMRVTLLSSITSFVLSSYCVGALRFAVVLISSFLLSSCFIYWLGLTKEEKKYMNNMIQF